ncbi:hypothetical protein EW146_g1482 [Bondarzewia mesenterica]|uniref:SGS domain-containing protein n=1 Tax=Bondarzewia mesenterica TaxID=1095465 RepID=A0A4S4M5Y0_9AGAM|nr:hypothetical protein EW146_g1482 [Bondarzewia mesenterica]
MTTIRHEFYETDEKLILTVFDRGSDPAQVNVKFEPRAVILFDVPPPVPAKPISAQVVYENGDKKLELQPLKGQIDPERSNFAVGKVKVEIRLVKAVQGRWGALIGDAPDPLSSFPSTSSPEPKPSGSTLAQARKNWDKVTTNILESEKEKSTSEDPNVGGDSTVNKFFQDLFSNADEDTRRAMLKSFQESGGTTLSTNWAEVSKAPVEVKPPQGSEWKKWAA